MQNNKRRACGAVTQITVHYPLPGGLSAEFSTEVFCGLQQAGQAYNHTLINATPPDVEITLRHKGGVAIDLKLSADRMIAL